MMENTVSESRVIPTSEVYFVPIKDVYVLYIEQKGNRHNLPLVNIRTVLL